MHYFLLFIDYDENQRPKKKQKTREPSIPKYKAPRVRCNCIKIHNSHFQGNCPHNCICPETGVKYDIGACPVCECSCDKVTLLTNVVKVSTQKRMMKHPVAAAQMSVAKEAAAYLQTGEKVRKNARRQMRESYTKKIRDGKMSKSAEATMEKSIDNHASYSKARYIVTNPPSREARKHLAEKMKVIVCCICIDFIL
jgi:hypothetical protein